MPSLIDLLSGAQQHPGQVNYSVATVTAVNASSASLNITVGSRSATNVTYLRSYAPQVGDKVHVIAAESVGLLVLGRSSTLNAPPNATSRIVTIQPIASMTWQEDPQSVEPGSATLGPVTQGGSVGLRFSGKYDYPTAAITLAADETIVKGEMLIMRVDPLPSLTVPPILHELTGTDPYGKPTYQAQYYFAPMDIASNESIWAPVPVDWATRIAMGETRGMVLAPSFAQWEYTYSQYGAWTLPFGDDRAGAIRVTVQKNPNYTPVAEPPPTEGGGGGAPGPAGPAGPTGATGPAGPQGSPGLPGPAGAAGATGATGAVGEVGPTGPAGAAGVGNIIGWYKVAGVWQPRPTSTPPPGAIVLWIGAPPAPTVGGGLAMNDDIYLQTDF
jgi:hypothetical protein